MSRLLVYTFWKGVVTICIGIFLQSSMLGLTSYDVYIRIHTYFLFVYERAKVCTLCVPGI